jgi:hypothetical protein
VKEPFLPLAVLAAALLVDCDRPQKPAAGRPASVGALPRGVLLPAPRFRPPADGLLTDDQVERFIRVRRAAKGRTDAETARALGVLPEELAWTRARIVEALVALDERRVREASAEVYAKALAQVKAARASVRDSANVRALEEQIAALERERATVRREETAPPALARNMRRVAGRYAELEAVAP